jgi:hypothetical protein
MLAIIFVVIPAASLKASLRVPVDQKHFLSGLCQTYSQVVVLPTPPFWLAMAMICVFMTSPHF